MGKSALRTALLLASGITIGSFGMHVLHAQQPSLIKGSPLLKSELTGENKDIYVTLVEAQPGAVFAKHTHPGDEFIILLEGTIVGEVEGQAPAEIKTGQALQIAREKVHGGSVAGTTPVKMVTVHVIDKGKPQREMAK